MAPAARPGTPASLRYVVGLLALALALFPAAAPAAPAVITADEAIEAALGRPAGATLQGLGSRVSQMGPDGNTAYEAAYPAIAYNTTDNQYLVVWYGDTNTGGLVDDEFEIWGQHIDAASGLPIGTNVRISQMGPDGNATYAATNPALAWNAADNQYLVAWYGDKHNGLANEEYEIWGQRLTASGGELGSDFRISSAGPDGDPAYDAVNPALIWNTADNEYLVVWQGNTRPPGLIGGEIEIWGQRLTATGGELGGDFRISQMGPEGSKAYGAASPGLAWNATENEYLVVWWGDTDAGGLLDDEHEIWGQRLGGAGVELGPDVRISVTGPDRNLNFNAFQPETVWNATENEYLVVWWATAMIGGQGDHEYEIWGGRISAAGARLGSDFRISNMGPDGDIRYDALTPAVAWLPEPNQYLVVWHGDTAASGLTDDESEIWGRRLSPAGTALGAQFRVSTSGPADGSTAYGAANVGVVGRAGGMALVVWQADSALGGLVDDELEIWGRVLRRVRLSSATYLPLVGR